MPRKRRIGDLIIEESAVGARLLCLEVVPGREDRETSTLDRREAEELREFLDEWLGHRPT